MTDPNTIKTAVYLAQHVNFLTVTCPINYTMLFQMVQILKEIMGTCRGIQVLKRDERCNARSSLILPLIPFPAVRGLLPEQSRVDFTLPIFQRITHLDMTDVQTHWDG